MHLGCKYKEYFWDLQVFGQKSVDCQPHQEISKKLSTEIRKRHSIMTVMTDDSFLNLRERELLVYIYYNIYILIFIFRPFFKNCHLSSVIIWQPLSLLKACWSLNVRMLIFMCEITDRLGCAYWSLWVRALLKNGGNVHRLSGLWRCLWVTPVQTVLPHGCAWPI